MVDPRLEKRYSETEVICMIHTASLCIRRDPHLRPRMSQVKKRSPFLKHVNSEVNKTLSCASVLFLLLKVLRLLEGDMVTNEISGRFHGRLPIEKGLKDHN